MDQLESLELARVAAAAVAAEEEAALPTLRAEAEAARAEFDRIRRAHMVRHIALLTGRTFGDD